MKNKEEKLYVEIDGEWIDYDKVTKKQKLKQTLTNWSGTIFILIILFTIAFYLDFCAK